MSSDIQIDIGESVTTVRLDDGGLNLITLEIASALETLIAETESNPASKCLILEGNKRAFSAGLDMKVLAQGGDAANDLLQTMGRVLVALYKSPLRVVSVCTGHAAAAGAMLLLVSDVRIGIDTELKVGFSEVANGMPLPELPILLIRDRIDTREQFAAAAISKMYGPKGALAAGFLDALVPDLKVARAQAQQAATQLARLDDTAYTETLRIVRGDTLRRLEEQGLA